MTNCLLHYLKDILLYYKDDTPRNKDSYYLIAILKRYRSKFNSEIPLKTTYKEERKKDRKTERQKERTKERNLFRSRCKATMSKILETGTLAGRVQTIKSSVTSSPSVPTGQNTEPMLAGTWTRSNKRMNEVGSNVL